MSGWGESNPELDGLAEELYQYMGRVLAAPPAGAKDATHVSIMTDEEMLTIQAKADGRYKLKKGDAVTFSPTGKVGRR